MSEPVVLEVTQKKEDGFDSKGDKKSFKVFRRVVQVVQEVNYAALEREANELDKQIVRLQERRAELTAVMDEIMKDPDKGVVVSVAPAEAAAPAAPGKP